MGGRRRVARWAAALSVVLLMGALVGCARDPSPPTDPELAEALGLPSSTPVYQVILGGVDDRTRVLPSHLSVPPGSLVQFVTADRRVYAVQFELSDAEGPAREFIRESGQEGSPPLSSEGARFVVSFLDAPEGRFPYRVEGYGATVRGVIQVASPQ